MEHSSQMPKTMLQKPFMYQQNGQSSGIHSPSSSSGYSSQTYVPHSSQSSVSNTPSGHSESSSVYSAPSSQPPVNLGSQSQLFTYI
jgi:hypothetical protein